MSKPAHPPAPPPPAPAEPESEPFELGPAALEVFDEPAPAKKAPAKAPARAASGGFLSLIHTIIPKPVLFGFYGALGGFLGVLILGELFWLVLQPPSQTTIPLTVAVAAGKPVKNAFSCTEPAGT